jgi:predicted PurR-regulated permease PerM
METNRQAVGRGFLTAVLLLLSLWVAWPFLPALAWAGVVAIAAWPARERLRARATPDVAAGALTVAVALAVLLPLLLFGVQLAREAGLVTAYVHDIREHGATAPDWLPRVPRVGAYLASWWQDHLASPDAAKELLGSAGPLGAAHWGRDIGSKVFRRAVIFGFTLLALFFIYRDGPQILVQGGRIAHRLFGPRAMRFGKDSIAAVRATVNGLVLVGHAEGLLLGIAYVMAGVTHAVLLGLATAVLAIVPFGAPAVLTIAGLVLLAQARMLAAILVLAFGAVVVFAADHFVRPLIIGSAIRLPFLWTLIGVFGGLEAFGVVGLFLGPAIMSVAMTIWRDAAGEENIDGVSARRPIGSLEAPLAPSAPVIESDPRLDL